MNDELNILPGECCVCVYCNQPIVGDVVTCGDDTLCQECYGEYVQDYDDAFGEDDERYPSDEEFDGQPDEYTEWQDYMGGDDWDQGQYDMGDY